MRGYKIFNPDWTCQGYQYTVGETFEMDGKPVLCERGFHFCERLVDCWGYKNWTGKEKIAEIEASGEIVGEDNKFATNKIRIIREISAVEMLIICNKWVDSLPSRGYFYRYHVALQRERVRLWWNTLSIEDKPSMRQLLIMEGITIEE